MLLEISERLNNVDFMVPNFPVTARNLPDKSGKITAREMESKISKSPNKSQASVSPNSNYR